MAKPRRVAEVPAAQLVERAFSGGLQKWIGPLSLSELKPYYSTNSGAAFNLDSLSVLRRLPSASVDLVLTSPPFALTRKKEYGNEPVERYLEWFMPFCLEIKRLLKPTGSFVLDIGGAWMPGAPVRSMYHFELAVHLAKKFNRRVLRPYSESMKGLIKNGYKAKMRPSGHDISDTFQRDNGGAIPPNLLEIANTESNSYYLRRCKALGIKPHPARYPEALAQFFVDLLTDEGDLVLDPFCGSNVTGAVAQKANRRWLACELRAEYLDGSIARFDLEEKPDPPELLATDKMQSKLRR